MSQSAHLKYSQFKTAHLEVWQRKDSTPWECAMFSLKVKNPLKLCLFNEPSEKRLHTLRYGKEKIARLRSVLCFL